LGRDDRGHKCGSLCKEIVGSWWTEKYPPMAIIENIRRGISWFRRIEHNGSWYWKIAKGGVMNQS